jgi:hypothetical protein
LDIVHIYSCSGDHIGHTTITATILREIPWEDGFRAYISVSGYLVNKWLLMIPRYKHNRLIIAIQIYCNILFKLSIAKAILIKNNKNNDKK